MEQFVAVFDDVESAADIRFTHAANAIAAFEAANWRADNSPFDRFLRGDRTAMSDSAKAGMRIFYSPKRATARAATVAYSRPIIRSEQLPCRRLDPEKVMAHMVMKISAVNV